MLYVASFDAALTGAGNITLSTAGESDAVVDLATLTNTDVEGTGTSSVFWHNEPSNATTSTNIRIAAQDPNSTARLTYFSRRSFGKALEVALEAAMTGWTTPSDLSISWSRTTGFYTIAWPHANFTITFATAIGRALLGFSGTQSGGTSYTSTLMPRYVIEPTLDTVSNNTLNYEPRGIANHGETDSGKGFGLARSTSPLYRDWSQEFETKEKTNRTSAATAHPWTFQHLFEHCRGQFPFAVVNGGFGDSAFTADEAFSLRTDSTHWDARDFRATPGNDSQFHIPFRCHVEGFFETY